MGDLQNKKAPGHFLGLNPDPPKPGHDHPIKLYGLLPRPAFIAPRDDLYPYKQGFGRGGALGRLPGCGEHAQSKCLLLVWVCVHTGVLVFPPYARPLREYLRGCDLKWTHLCVEGESGDVRTVGPVGGDGGGVGWAGLSSRRGRWRNGIHVCWGGGVLQRLDGGADAGRFVFDSHKPEIMRMTVAHKTTPPLV